MVNLDIPQLTFVEADINGMAATGAALIDVTSVGLTSLVELIQNLLDRTASDMQHTSDEQLLAQHSAPDDPWQHQSGLPASGKLQLQDHIAASVTADAYDLMSFEVS